MFVAQSETVQCIASTHFFPGSSKLNCKMRLLSPFFLPNILLVCAGFIFHAPFASLQHTPSTDRTFKVDYDRNAFLKDGQPFRYIAGTLHYFQIPTQLWRDRMLRVRALGCNALQTYVMWNRHEPYEGQYDFDSDGANLTQYISLAQELGFVVVLRVGPYIDAEMDLGGLPYWLLKRKDMVLRSTRDPRYLQAVEKWMTVLLPKVKPLLYINGGPVITVQIENEYGLYPECDKKYMIWMRNLARKLLGDEVVLFTTDGPAEESVRCGMVEGVLPTIDFGVYEKQRVASFFTSLRKFLPKGPMVNSEFYPGWLDKWGNKKHAVTPTQQILDTIESMWSYNVTSFTIYPAHGGTNWGYSAGALAKPFQGVTTGYDFDAPISEAGDTTPKFLAVRQKIESITNRSLLDPVPQSPVKYAYGKVQLQSMGNVIDLVHALTDAKRITKSLYPLTMEDLDQPYGFVLYETDITNRTGCILLQSFHDRAYVMLDGKVVVLQRDDKQRQKICVRGKATRAAQHTLRILVENQGRICFGPDMNTDRKGLLRNVTMGEQVLTNWTMYPIDLQRVYQLSLVDLRRTALQNANRLLTDAPNPYLPSLYYGGFFAEPAVGDTFFDPSGWGKGQLFINGKNMGRYWPQAGPQVTLYVPKVFLNAGYNQIYTFEMDKPGGCEDEQGFICWADFVDKPKYVA